MADVFDQAQAFDALNLAQGLAAQQALAAMTARPKSVGHCLNSNCEEPFNNPERLFCNPSCEREYTRMTQPHSRRLH